MPISNFKDGLNEAKMTDQNVGQCIFGPLDSLRQKVLYTKGIFGEEGLWGWW